MSPAEVQGPFWTPFVNSRDAVGVKMEPPSTPKWPPRAKKDSKNVPRSEISDPPNTCQPEGLRLASVVGLKDSGNEPRPGSNFDQIEPRLG